MDTKITKGDPGQRDEGVGNVLPTLIRERASELAVIDGRDPEDLRASDVRQAEEELRGRHVDAAEANLQGGRTHEPDEAAGTMGRQRTTRDLDPEQSDRERLVEEGIEEAVHDDMVESGRETREEEPPG